MREMFVCVGVALGLLLLFSDPSINAFSEAEVLENEDMVEVVGDEDGLRKAVVNNHFVNDIVSLLQGVIKILSSCSLTFVSDEFYMPVVEAFSKSEDYRPCNIFEIEQGANSSGDLSSFLTKAKKESCLHYIFLISDIGRLVKTIDYLYLNSLELTSKFIVVTGSIPDPNDDNIVMKAVKSSPLNKIVNLLFVYPEVEETTKSKQLSVQKQEKLLSEQTTKLYGLDKLDKSASLSQINVSSMFDHDPEVDPVIPLLTTNGKKTPKVTEEEKVIVQLNKLRFTTEKDLRREEEEQWQKQNITSNSGEISAKLPRILFQTGLKFAVEKTESFGTHLPQDETMAFGPESTPLSLYTHIFFTNNQRDQTVLLGWWYKGALRINEESYLKVNDQKNISSLDIWFPKKLGNFHGFQMKVTTFHYPPMVIFEKNGEFDGLEMRLLKTLASALNFKFKVSNPKDGEKWGRELPNGSWTGALGEVQRSDADISFANYFITGDRLVYFDMCSPHHVDQTCFITPVPQPIPRYTVVLRPFDYLVWFTIIMVLIALPPLIKVFSTYEPVHWFSSLSNATWYTWGLILGNSMPYNHYPQASFIRITVAGTFLGSFVLSVAYRTSLFTLLLLPSPGRPVNSLQELLYSGLEWGVRSTGGWEKWFSESTDPTAQKIAQGFEFVDNIQSGIDRVKKGKFAFMNSGTMLRYVVGRDFTDEFGRKELHITKECFISFRIGLAIPKYSVYWSTFNGAVEKTVEAGLVNYWFGDIVEQASREKRINDRKKPKDSQTTPQTSSSKVLGLYDLQGSFYILFLGWGIGLFFFIFEKVWFWWFVEQRKIRGVKKKMW